MPKSTAAVAPTTHHSIGTTSRDRGTAVTVRSIPAVTRVVGHGTPNIGARARRARQAASGVQRARHHPDGVARNAHGYEPAPGDVEFEVQVRRPAHLVALLQLPLVGAIAQSL